MVTDHVDDLLIDVDTGDDGLRKMMREHQQTGAGAQSDDQDVRVDLAQIPAGSVQICGESVHGVLLS